MAYEIKKLPDGKVDVQYEDGYSLKGVDPMEATEQLAKRGDDRARVAAEWKQKAETAQAELDRVAAEQQVQQQQQQQQAQQSADPAWSPFVANQNANYYGYKTAEEYKAAQETLLQEHAQMKKELEEFRNHAIAGSFMGANPDYPNTPEANEAIIKLLTESGSPVNEKTLRMAHAELAYLDKVYEPLNQDLQDAASGNQSAQARVSRPKAAPMMASSSPESQAGPVNAWDLKDAAAVRVEYNKLLGAEKR